jgi:predicted membrane-bound spermidine synthase
MNRREFKVEKSFTISVGDLIFQIKNNGLFILKENIGVLHTPITVDEMITLSEFCTKATDILQPIPGNKLIYVNNSGPQTVSIFVNERNNYSLLINSQLQFMTESEEIYHEALVGPAVCSLNFNPKNFLILGGGDGLVAKQIFKENPNIASRF